jgi:hypothetical protein
MEGKMRMTLYMLLGIFAGAMVIPSSVMAKPSPYTYTAGLEDNTLVDPSITDGGKTWYQWIYNVSVIADPGGSDHFGLSHFTIELPDCYDEKLLATIADTAGANTGNLYGLSGDQPRSYNIEYGLDGSTGLIGIKWESVGGDQLDSIGEFDYFWFSVPTSEAVTGTSVVKAGTNQLFFEGDVPDCPDCEPPVTPKIPEPMSCLLLGSGLVGALLRRKNRIG